MIKRSRCYVSKDIAAGKSENLEGLYGYKTENLPWVCSEK